MLCKCPECKKAHDVAGKIHPQLIICPRCRKARHEQIVAGTKAAARKAFNQIGADELLEEGFNRFGVYFTSTYSTSAQSSAKHQAEQLILSGHSKEFRIRVVDLEYIQCRDWYQRPFSVPSANVELWIK